MTLLKYLFLIAVLSFVTRLDAQTLTWKQLDGPSGAVILSLVTTSTGEVLVSTPQGVYKSTNHGANWKPSGRELPATSFYRLTTASIDSARPLLFCTIAEKAVGSNVVIFFESKDRGETWHRIFPLTPPYVQNTYGHFLPDGRITVGDSNVYFMNGEGFAPRRGVTPFRIYRSNDSGNLWMQTSIDSVTPFGDIFYSLPARMQSGAQQQGALFAYNQSRSLFRSLDNGNTWSAITNINHQADSNCHVKGKDGIVYFFGDGAGCFRSTDLGNSWQNIGVTLPSNRVYDMMVDKSNALFCAIPNGVYRSRDNGITWQGPLQGIISNSVGIIGCDSINVLYAATSPNAGISGSGVFLSTDGGDSWHTRDEGLPRLNVMTVAADRKGFVYTTTVQSGLFRSSTRGDTWDNLTRNRALPIAFDRTQRMYAGIAPSPLFYASTSTDQGLTWQNNIRNLSPYSYATGPDGSMYMSTYDEGIFHSTDLGAHWDTLSVPNYKVISKIRKLFYLSVARNHDLFAASYYAAYRSLDRGKSWEQMPINLTGVVTAMAVDSVGDIYLGTDDGKVQVSHDRGVSWSLTTLETHGGYVKSFLVTRNGTIYAGTYSDSMYTASGVYRLGTSNTWLEVSKGLLLPSVGHFPDIVALVEGSDGSLYAGTTNEGIFRGEYLVENSVAEISSAATISVYPNPATSSTTIAITSDRSETIRIQLFDLLGREMYAVEREVQTGTNKIGIQTQELPPGMYQLRVVGASSSHILSLRIAR